MAQSFIDKTQRGIALATAVMFALVMTVIGHGILRLNLGTQAQQSSHEKRAKHAALSGLEYAKSQLAKDSEWRGRDDRRRTLETSDMVVEEVDGNIIGLISYPDGGKAQFRIRFNGQDGPGGVDGLNDPEAGFKIDNRLLSLNNLNENSRADLPEIDESFRAMSTIRDTVPGHSALVQVEGRAGPGIDKLTALTESPSGHTKSVQVETVLKVTLPSQDGTGVLQAGSQVDLKVLGNVRVMSADGVRPALRSKQAIGVDNFYKGVPATLDMEGDVYCRDGDLSASFNPNDVTVHSEDPNSNFMQLTWDQIDKPGTEAVELSGGVYVLWPEGASGVGSPPTMHYYDMTYDDYVAQIYSPYILDGKLPPNPGVVISANLQEVRPPGDIDQHPTGILLNQNELSITEDVSVLSSPNNVTDFAIIPLSDAPMQAQGTGPLPPSAVVGPPPGPGLTAVPVPLYGNRPLTVNVENSRIYSQGPVTFKGGLLEARGASLVGEEGLTFNTKTLTVRGDEQNLSLYFKGDVKMSTLHRVPSGAQEYGVVKIIGTIYSWSNIEAYLGEAGNPDGGIFAFQGAMIAYGGDPASVKPGSSGGGAISIQAKSVEMCYDPTAITQLVAPEDLGGDLEISTVSQWIR